MGVALASAFGSFIGRVVLPQYGQTAIWMARITDQTPGAIPGPAFEPYRQQNTSQGDGTYGVGWMAYQGGQLRKGYLAPVQIQVGLDDLPTEQTFSEVGRTNYEQPVISYAATVPIAKGDLIALSDGRRFVVGDEMMPEQVNGTTVMRSNRLEGRSPNDPIYAVSLT